jgi:methylglutaconyl-CoA hydratase
LTETVNVILKADYAGAWVSEVILNRPALHNAFNADMIEAITAAFETLGTLPGTCAIVLKANGKSFSAGADLNWMQAMIQYTQAQNQADASRLATMMRTINACPKPTIALVTGAAFGGGVGLVAACDMALALSSVQFCLSEVKLGILPAVILPYVLQKTGLSAVSRYCLTAERFTAETAKLLGLVTEVFPEEALAQQQLNTMVQALSQTAPSAVKRCKQLIAALSSFGKNMDEIEALTIAAIASQRVSEEGQEGMRAFLEKRPPVWQHANPNL